MDRTLILREPGHVVFDGATFFSSGPITVELMENVVDLTSGRFGKFDEIPTGRMISIKFMPLLYVSTQLAKLFPFGSLALGSSIFGGADKTLDVHTITGKRGRVPNAAVYQEPALRGSISQTVLGEVEFRGIVPNNGNGNALTNFWNETSVAYPGDAAFDVDDVLTPAFAVSWGADPWDELDLTDEGFTITPKPALVEDSVNGKGVVNIAITDYAVETTFEPMGLTRAAVLARMGFGTALGGRKSASAADFVAAGTGCHLTAYRAHLKSPVPLSFDREARSVGKLTLVSTRTVTAGSATPLLRVDTAAPEA